MNKRPKVRTISEAILMFMAAMDDVRYAVTELNINAIEADWAMTGFAKAYRALPFHVRAYVCLTGLIGGGG